jgi:hypothetical protein
MRSKNQDRSDLAQITLGKESPVQLLSRDSLQTGFGLLIGFFRHSHSELQITTTVSLSYTLKRSLEHTQSSQASLAVVL